MVGLVCGRIIILDAVTGAYTSILSEHNDQVRCLTFSLDGALLVSGSNDTTIKLWDTQTGGVIRTFYGHTNYVTSVSISLDCTTIISGSWDKTIRLWGVSTGECCYIIEGCTRWVTSVSFSKNSQIIISSFEDCTVRWWGVDGHQIQQVKGGPGVAFSPDGTKFVSFGGMDTTVQNSDSGVVVAELPVANDQVQSCCFSPDGRTIAGAIGSTIYLWDINGSVPHLVETFVGHTENIYSLEFSSPSTLISASYDRSAKFWQIGASPKDSVVTSSGPTPALIKSVSLQSADSIAISSDSAGVVRMLDISTGIYRVSFQTPCPEYINQRDIQLIDSRLIFVWCGDKNKEVHVWDVTRNQLLRKIHVPSSWVFKDLRISGDRSKVFYVDSHTIYAYDIWTGEAVGKVELVQIVQDCLTVQGTKIWVRSIYTSTQGWEFGIPGSSPVQLLNTPSERPHLDFVDGTKSWNSGLSRVEDTATGKGVFYFFGKYGWPLVSQWDGCYLIAAYGSEVLILDFFNVLP